MFTSNKKIYVLAWFSLKTSLTVTIIKKSMYLMFTSNKFNSNNNKIKDLCTWCTKTCVWKSAVLSLTVAFKNVRYFFYSIKHKFLTFKISLSASLSARRLKSSWSLLWLSCKNSTRSPLSSLSLRQVLFLCSFFWNVLGFLLSSFRTPFLVRKSY